jgi:hypothetical protein
MLNTNLTWHILKKVVLRFKFTIFSALKAICQLKNKFPHTPRYMENPCCYGVPTKGSWYKQRKKQVYSKKVKMTLICRLAIVPKSLINTRKIIPQYVVSNHVNSDHVPSFSCLHVWSNWQTTSGVYAMTQSANFGWVRFSPSIPRL